MDEGADARSGSVFGLALSVELGLGLLALVIGRLAGLELIAPGPAVGLPGIASPGLLSPPAAVLLGLLAALPPLIAVYLMRLSRRPAIQELLRVSRHFVEEYLSPIRLPGVVVLSAAAGFGEELLFRGLLQSWIAGWGGLAAALLITSIIFALLHAVTRAYALYAFALSLYLGLLYVITGNILAPMVAHAAYDGVLLALLRRSIQR